MAAIRSAQPLRLGGELHLSIAGAETNVAIGMVRLGWPARWIGVVGDDEFGALVLRVLRAEGVEISGARVEESGETGLVFFEYRLHDVTRVTYRRAGSAGSRLSVRDVEIAFGETPDVLLITGITPALGARPREAVKWAVANARDAGLPVCLDVNYRAALWSRSEAATVLTQLAEHADVVIASEDELELVAPARANTEELRVAALLDRGVEQVVIKRSSRGASVYWATGSCHESAVRTRVVSSVGAGDAFVAGFLSGLLENLEPATRLKRAVAVSAFAVGCSGDWEGLPTLAELSLLSVPSGTALR